MLDPAELRARVWLINPYGRTIREILTPQRHRLRNLVGFLGQRGWADHPKGPILETMSIPPQLWSFTERHQRFFKTKECLAACDHSPCGGQIVRAHMIPRAQLRQIARGGRIVAEIGRAHV